MKDTTKDPSAYFEFYEEVGQKYPEAAISHSERWPGSRYWTVWKELRPFAKRGDKLLDIGCNEGVYTIPYCENEGYALGIDISPTLIQKAKYNSAHLRGKCEFMVADIEDPDIFKVISEASFDVVLFSEVLEHLRNPEQALRNIHRLLKPNGYLILTAPTPLFEKTHILTIRYAYTTLAGRKLLESQVIDTTKTPILQKYGIPGYLYRHDGYYPRALRKYVESMNFRCIWFYTMGLAIAVIALRRRLVALFKRSRGDSVAESRYSDDSSLIGAVKRVATPLVYAFDLVLRKIPLINLFGITNVGIFQKE